MLQAPVAEGTECRLESFKGRAPVLPREARGVARRIALAKRWEAHLNLPSFPRPTRFGNCSWFGETAG